MSNISNEITLDNLNNKLFKDYTPKIIKKLYNGENLQEKSEDINNLIVLLNWCFHTKNNFFIEDFNKRLVHPVCDSYNKLKSNILGDNIFYNIEEVFADISPENIKTLRFILLRYINIYDTLLENHKSSDNRYNINTLWERVTKNSMKNCVGYMENYVAELKK